MVVGLVCWWWVVSGKMVVIIRIHVVGLKIGFDGVVMVVVGGWWYGGGSGKR
jgi:hypothetical protein